MTLDSSSPAAGAGLSGPIGDGPLRGAGGARHRPRRVPPHRSAQHHLLGDGAPDLFGHGKARDRRLQFGLASHGRRNFHSPPRQPVGAWPDT